MNRTFSKQGWNDFVEWVNEDRKVARRIILLLNDIERNGNEGIGNGKRFSDEYDYDAEYLVNGMSYLILPGTKTEQYVFGISWIDDVGRNDPGDGNHNRDIQTWFGADPTVSF